MLLSMTALLKTAPGMLSVSADRCRPKSAFLSILCSLCALPVAAAVQPIAPIDAVTAFDDAGIFASGFAVTNGPAQMFPANARIACDEATGATVDTDSHRDARHGCFMHPPYKKGWGITFQEFTVALPASPSAAIEGFTALAEGAENSDGVTYRILVNGTSAWEDNRRSIAWLPFRAELSTWAGKTVTIRFEVTPGPKNDTAYDWALWSDRKLLLPGYRGPVHPEPPPLDLRKLSSKQNESWAPLSGFDGGTSVKLDNFHSATLSYRGDDGALTYVWKLRGATERPSSGALDASNAWPLGTMTLNATMTGDRHVEIPLVNGAQILWTNDVHEVNATFTKHRNAIELTRTFRNAAGDSATLTSTAKIEDKSLVLDFACDKPWIKEFSPGDWGPVAIRRKLPMPYYGHDIEFLPAENMFVSRFPDWTASQASHFRNERAIYESLTDGTRNTLHERYIFSAAWHVDEVMANIPNPPSPWREDFGRRIVFDIWGGRYSDNARALDELAKYGVRHDYIIYHDWQRDGYDNGLPAHFPANANLGGEPGMTNLSATAKRLGHLFALHENYVDYYPNYEHFTTNDITLRSDGALETAWYNPGTKIQSFAIKPAAIMRLAHEQSPVIHKRYGTTASYLDVHSCVPLWFHVDQCAGEPDAGSLQAVWKAHRDLWKFERATHGGPETGEGNGHWPWSGWLDGVEAQFGTGWGHNSGRTAPLLVDFDLLRIHPLQLNHGQGYYDRWLEKTHAWGGGIPMVVMDQYRMQEVVFGHIGFVGDLRPDRVWLEQNLMVSVTSRHATSRVKDIRYFINGQWLDTTAAMKSETGIPARQVSTGAGKDARAALFQRVRVTYENGLTITANGEETDFEIDGVTLPPFGWLARAKAFEAGTARRDGVVVDFVKAPDVQFANARRDRDWNTGAPAPIRVRVADFQALEDHRFRISYAWACGCALSRDLHCFVHFDKPGRNDYHFDELTQQDHSLNKPTTAWTNGETILDGPYNIQIPDGAADGSYAMHIGLWDKQGRLALDGPNDGAARIRLGDLVISGKGTKVSFEPAKDPDISSAAMFHRHLNVEEKTVDFGFVKTDGSVLRKREHGTWKQWTFPASGDVHIEFAP